MIYVGDSKINRKSPEFKEPSNCLIGGDEDSGKSLYLAKVLTHLTKEETDDLEVYSYGALEAKKDGPLLTIKKDIPSLLDAVDPLLKDTKEREAHKKTILVMIDGLEKKDEALFPRIEEMMAICMNKGIYFMVTSRYPKLFTKKMKESSPRKICFQVDDGSDSGAILGTGDAEELPLIDEPETRLGYLEENDEGLTFFVIQDM